MDSRIEGRGTAQSTPWAPPLACDKKNAGETDGKASDNDGSRKPDMRSESRKVTELWRIATWNVGSVTGRGRELAEEMHKRRIDVMCVQETRWGGNAARELGGGYKLVYSGKSNKRNGVGIILSQKWKDKVLEVKRVSDRLMGEGRRILDMAQRNDLMVCNTRYKKKDDHLITYSSGGRKSQLDFVLVKQSDAKNLKNCIVMPGNDIVSQHRTVVIEWWRSKESKRKDRKIEKFKTWQLKKEGTKFREKVQKASAVRTEDGGVEEMWYEMKEALRKASEEVLGRTKPGRKKQKKSWWWSDGVREALKEKLAFKKWQRTNLDVDREEYKVKKKEAKRAVEIARKEGTQELYD